MTQQFVEITFPDASPDSANYLVESLAKDIRGNVKEGGLPVDPEIVRTDPTAQDFGTTLTILLGTPAIIILANTLRDWARRTDRSVIMINGHLITNLESKDVADVVKAMNLKKE